MRLATRPVGAAEALIVGRAVAGFVVEAQHDVGQSAACVGHVQLGKRGAAGDPLGAQAGRAFGVEFHAA